MKVVRHGHRLANHGTSKWDRMPCANVLQSRRCTADLDPPPSSPRRASTRRSLGSLRRRRRECFAQAMMDRIHPHQSSNTGINHLHPKTYQLEDNVYPPWLLACVLPARRGSFTGLHARTCVCMLLGPNTLHVSERASRERERERERER